MIMQCQFKLHVFTESNYEVIYFQNFIIVFDQTFSNETSLMRV